MAKLRQISGRYLAAGGLLLLAAVLVGGVIATFLEQEATFPEGSAEAIVQRYEKAVADGDWDAAYAFLANELQQACPLEEIAPMRFAARDSQRVTLLGSEMFGNSLVVTVRVTESEFDGPFGAGQRTFERRYSLALANGQWRFSEFPQPFHGCPEAREAAGPTRIQAP